MKRLTILFAMVTAGLFAQNFIGSGPRPPIGVPITFAALGLTNTTANVANYEVTGVQVSANALALCWIVTSAATPADATSVTGCNLTWVKIATRTNYNSAGASIQVWRSMTNALTPSGTVQATFAAGQTGANMRVVQFKNVDTSGSNGSGAVIQNLFATNAIANPSLTLAALGSAKNAVMAGIGNVDSNGNAGTAEANWVEDLDDGYNTPATGIYTTYQIGLNDNSIAVTQTAQQWAMIGLEIKTANP